MDTAPPPIVLLIPPHPPHLEHGRLRLTQLMKGGLPSGHLNDGAAQGPDVSRGSISPGALVDDLRGHILKGA